MFLKDPPDVFSKTSGTFFTHIIYFSKQTNNINPSLFA